MQIQNVLSSDKGYFNQISVSASVDFTKRRMITVAMKMIINIKQGVSIAVFLIFLIAVEWLWGWAEILRPWQDMAISHLILGLVLLFVGYVAKTLRLYDYFYPQARWWESLRLMLMHNLLNNLLPARTGELSFPLLMKRYFQVNYLQSTPALLWFRILDLYMLLSVGMLVWLLQSQVSMLLWFAFAIWLLTPMILYLIQRQLMNWVATKKRVNTSGTMSKVFTITGKLLAGLPANFSQFAKSWFYTLLNWGVKLLTLAWFMSLFISVDFKYLMSSIVAGELTAVLPIHAPGGFGTYEAGMLTVLAPLADNTLAATAAINTHLIILGAAALGAGIAWFIPINKD